MIPPHVYYVDCRSVRCDQHITNALNAFGSTVPEGSVLIVNSWYTDPSASVSTSGTVVSPPAIPTYQVPGDNYFGGITVTLMPPAAGPGYVYLDSDRATDGTYVLWQTTSAGNASAATQGTSGLVASFDGAWFRHNTWRLQPLTGRPMRGYRDPDFTKFLGQLGTILQTMFPNWGELVNSGIYIDKPTDIRIVCLTGRKVATSFTIREESFTAVSSAHKLPEASGSVQMFRWSAGSWHPETVQSLGTFPRALAGKLPASADPHNFFVWDGSRWQAAVDSLWYPDPSAPSTTAYQP